MEQIPFEANIAICKAQDLKGNWIVEGYAGVSSIDITGDEITEEAFQLSEKDLLKNSTVLYNHDVDEPIGHVVDARVKKLGNKVALWIKAHISKTAPKRWQQIQDRTLNKFSIRGLILDAVKKVHEDTDELVRQIRKMYLQEVSLCAVPINTDAEAINSYIEKALTNFEKNGGIIPAADRPSAQAFQKSNKREGPMKTLKDRLAEQVEADLTSLKAVKGKVSDEVAELVDPLIQKAESRKETISKMENDLDPTDEEIDTLETLVANQSDETQKATLQAMLDKAKKKKKKKEEDEDYPYPPPAAEKQYSQEDIDKAVEDAKQPLQQEIDTLKAEKDKDKKPDEEKKAMKETIDTLKAKIEAIENKVGSVEKVAGSAKQRIESDDLTSKVETMWKSKVGTVYAENSADKVKPIFKKMLAGEPINQGEYETLETERLSKGNLMVGGAGIEQNGRPSRDQLIKEGGIKVPEKKE